MGKTLEVGITISSHLERELGAYNAEDLVFRRNSKGLLDVYVYLPPYVDTSSDIYIELIGYAIFDSPFGEFAKKIQCERVRIAPEDWKT